MAISPKARIGVRVAQAVLVLIALALVGSGSCVYFAASVPGKAATAFTCERGFPINSWSSNTGTGGQYFVFISSIFLLIATILAILLALTQFKNRFVALGIAGAGILLCFLSGCLEMWYGVGWNKSFQKVDFYILIIGWIVAGIFYFISAALYAVDLLFSLKSE